MNKVGLIAQRQIMRHEMLIVIGLIFISISSYACDYTLSAAKTSEWVTNSVYCLNVSLTDQVGNTMIIDADNVTFDCQGFTLDGDDSGTDAAITISSTTNTTIRNCIFSGHNRMILGNIMVTPVIYNSTFILTSSYIGMRTYGTGWHIYNNTFAGTSNTGYSIYDIAASSNWLIENNTFTNTGGLYSISTMDNLTFRNNTLINPNSFGMDFNGVSQTNITIQDNYFSNVTSGTLKNALNFRNPMIELNIYNNTFDSSTRSIYFYPTVAKSNVNITGNTFSNILKNTVNGHVYIYEVTNLTINENIVKDNISSSFSFLYNTTNLVVNNNVFGTEELPVNMLGADQLLIEADGIETAQLNNNSIYCTLCSGFFLMPVSRNVNNINITNNTFYSYQEPVRGFGIGYESPVAYTGTNNRIEGNNVTCGSDGGNSAHGIFMGFIQNSSILDNNLTGGTHGIVVKTTQNITVTGNRAWNNKYNNFYDKGSTNCTFTNNIGYQPNNVSYLYAIRIADNPTISNATNSIWINNTITYTSGITVPVKIEPGQNVTIINTAYTTTDEQVSGNLTRQWWHRVYVTYNGNPMTSLNISIYNASYDWNANETLEATGYSNYTILTEYITVDASRRYVDDYELNGTYNSQTISTDITLNQTQTTNFSFTGCGTLNHSITLDHDIENNGSTCFIFGEHNITLDGDGHYVRSNLTTDTYGVISSAYENATIENLAIHNFTIGIYLNDSSEASVTSNNITNTTSTGIMIANTTISLFSNNRINSSLNAIEVSSGNLTFSGNNYVYSPLTNGYEVYLGTSGTSRISTGDYNISTDYLNFAIVNATNVSIQVVNLTLSVLDTTAITSITGVSDVRTAKLVQSAQGNYYGLNVTNTTSDASFQGKLYFNNSDTTGYSISYLGIGKYRSTDGWRHQTATVNSNLGSITASSTVTSFGYFAPLIYTLNEVDTQTDSNKKTLSIGYEFDCSNGKLKIALTHGDTNVSNVIVRLFRQTMPFRELVGGKTTDGTGKAIFDISENGFYEIETVASGSYRTATLGLFELTLCQLEQTPEDGETVESYEILNQSEIDQEETPEYDAELEAELAMERARNAIDEARTGGMDVSEAEAKLAEAKEAFEHGIYSEVDDLAAEAYRLALNAQNAAGDNKELEQNQTEINENAQNIEKPQQNEIVNSLILLLIVIGVIALVVGIHYMVRKKRSK